MELNVVRNARSANNFSKRVFRFRHFNSRLVHSTCTSNTAASDTWFNAHMNGVTAPHAQPPRGVIGLVSLIVSHMSLQLKCVNLCGKQRPGKAYQRRTDDILKAVNATPALPLLAIGARLVTSLYGLDATRLRSRRRRRREDVYGTVKRRVDAAITWWGLQAANQMMSIKSAVDSEPLDAGCYRPPRSVSDDETVMVAITDDARQLSDSKRRYNMRHDGDIRGSFHVRKF